MSSRKTRTKRREAKQRVANATPGATGEPRSSNATAAQPPAATPPAAMSPAAVGGQNPPASARRRFVLAAAVVLGWWAVLVGMVAFTANPVTLNRRQVALSDAVVKVEVLDVDSGRVNVLETWKRRNVPAELAIPNLAAGGAKTGGTYLVPVRIAPDGGCRITRVLVGDEAPLIYPASDESVEQLELLLSERRSDGETE